MNMMKPTFLACCALVCAVGAADAQTSEGAEESGQKEGVNAAPAAPRDREKLRYAGRTFAEWRDQLLNDLEPKTCVEAMAPITAFGKKGYHEEAVAALAEMLDDDRADVVENAAGELAQLGPSAIPVLLEALSDARASVRVSAAYALHNIGPSAKGASQALAALLDDKDENVRVAAAASLVAVARDEKPWIPTFERMAQSDDFTIRQAFVGSFQRHVPKGDWWVPLLVQLADDDAVRQSAAVVLINHAPPTTEVLGVLKQVIADQQFGLQVSQYLGAPPTTATKIKLIADLLPAEGGIPGLATTNVIAMLGQARDQAEIVVPLLIQIANSKATPRSRDEIIVAAIDSLGRMGRSAKTAIPLLERWTFREADVPLDNGRDSIQKHAQRALRKIAAAEE